MLRYKGGSVKLGWIIFSEAQIKQYAWNCDWIITSKHGLWLSFKNNSISMESFFYGNSISISEWGRPIRFFPGSSDLIKQDSLAWLN